MDIIDEIESIDQLNNQNKLRDCYIELANKLQKFSKSLSTLNNKTKENICKASVRVIESCPNCKKIKETVYQ